MLANLEKRKNSVSYQSVLLATFSGVAAALLAVSHYVTQPVIELRLEEDQNAMLEQVLNGQAFANKVFDEAWHTEFAGLRYQIAPVKNQQGRETHYVVSSGEEGYSGEIRYLMGVDRLGNITGVRILSHTETPGLGDKIELAKSDWVLSFNGRSLSNTPLWAVKKDGGDFDQFSGATITPRAVVRGIHKALLALEKDKESRDE
jgi:electron transport complex protein RnfG